jgi:V/A-type H+-transporting ATPase subunit K
MLIPAVAVALLAAPIVPVLVGAYTGKKARRTLVFNLCAFAGVVLLMVFMPLGGFIGYASEANVSLAQGLTTGEGLGFIGAALVTGLSCLGAGIAVASAAPAAIGATSEDPKSFGKALIFVVLGEGVALYGLLISILIINAIG